jgi:DNA-binding MarR family transcriptional regulator
MKFDGHIGPLLGYCSTLCRMNMDKLMSEYGMTQTQTHVMLYLAKGGGREITQSDIERTFHIKASTVNGIVNRLEEKELVERAAGKNDGRCRSIKLTKKGVEMYEVFRAGARANERKITSGFTKEEKDALASLLGRVVNNLGEDIK